MVTIDDPANHIVVHPEWNKTDVAAGFDIAVINLPQSLTFNSYIRAVSLPARSDANLDWARDIGRASGWGYTSDRATALSPVINFVDEEIKTNEACNLWWSGRIYPNKLCGDGNNGWNNFFLC